MRAALPLLTAVLAASCLIPEKELDEVDDVTPPETALVDPPVPYSNLATPELMFSASEPSTFECSIDGEEPEPCESPWAPPELVDGAHVFTVIATDLAGNVDETPAEHTWTVDVVLPGTIIDMGPPANDSSSDVMFWFSSSEACVEFECSLDDSGFAPCVMPFSFTVADGRHRFGVRAVDCAGNVDPTPAFRNWALGPTVTLTGPENDAVTGPYVTWYIEPSPGATVVCGMDGATPQPCPDEWSGNLPAGPHTLLVIASDGMRTYSESRDFIVVCGPNVEADSLALLHFSEGTGQTLDNLVPTRPDAVLGTSAAVEDSDPMWIAASRMGSGLALANQDVVTWPAALGVVDAYTIELWAKWPFDVAVSQPLVTVGGAPLVTLEPSNEGTFIRYAGMNKGPFPPGGWHHVVVSFDDANRYFALVVDGWGDNSDAADTPLPDLSLVQFGPTLAEIDEVHIRSTSRLSASEVWPFYCPLP